ncbi:MAG: hypothetical protein WA584_04990 [Pyrinomonadaceae bacterium]
MQLTLKNIKFFQKVSINWNYCLIVMLLLSVVPAFMNISIIWNKVDSNISSKTANETNSPASKGFVIDEKISADKQQILLTSDEAKQETTRLTEDGSEIKTTYDAYGNKTEVRIFHENPRLKQLLIRTSADGQRHVYVYGQNGEVESLPDKMLEKAMSAPANEIADVAGIFKTKQEKTLPTPMPSVQMPVQQTVAPNQVQMPAAENAEENKTPVEKSSVTKEIPKTKGTDTKIKL